MGLKCLAYVILNLYQTKKPLDYQVVFSFLSDPDWIRTNGPQLRRLLLYPAELRGQFLVLS
jgi:hypothetical protein